MRHIGHFRPERPVIMITEGAIAGLKEESGEAGLARARSYMTNDRHQRATWDGWAQYYDLIVGDRTAMASFYRDLISRQTRSVLELACGTGTITIALAHELFRHNGAAAAHRIVGLDESNAMLRIARARDCRIQWVQGDMRCPSLEASFDFVVCCFNTVQSILTQDELQRFFGTVAHLVRRGGIFAFDIYQPNLQYLSMPRTDRVYRSLTDVSGLRLDLREDYRYDPRARILTMNQRLVEHGRNSEEALSHIEYRYAQYFADDIERLLSTADFCIRERYGDFDRSTLTDRSKKQVFVCERC
jgi:SAM-dependent methyltransferase